MTAPGDDALATYRRHGLAWARQRRIDLTIESGWLDRFCVLLPPGGTVLDIGCGTGVPIAREMVRRGFRVTGLDGTPALLDLFRRTLPDATAHLLDMRAMALGRAFDGLVAWDSLFHLTPDEQRAMIPRLAAHAAPGAALMFTSGDAQGTVFGTLEGEPLHHGSLGPAEYRARLAGVGFTVVDHVAGDPTCGDHTVWLARRSDCAASPASLDRPA